MSRGVRGDALGDFPCTDCGCCDGNVYPFTVYNDSTMRCSNCSCTQTRMDTNLVVRLYVQGQMTVKTMEQVLVISRLLGCDDDNFLKRESDLSHYVEIPAEGISTRLEIANLTRL